MAIGRTNFQTPNDPNLIAGNIKNNVSILGVIGNYDYEATNPITAATVLSGKVGFVNGSKITGTLSPGLGDIYITTLDMPMEYGTISTSFNLVTSYALASGNYIYCPVAYQENGAVGITMLYFTTDSSAYPARTTWSESFTSTSLSSTYLDSGVIYFNFSNSHYTYFTIATNTWYASDVSGSHTSGTLINTDLTLNGFKYTPAAATGAIQDSVYRYFIPLVNVTKL